MHKFNYNYNAPCTTSNSIMPLGHHVFTCIFNAPINSSIEKTTVTIKVTINLSDPFNGTAMKSMLTARITNCNYGYTYTKFDNYVDDFSYLINHFDTIFQHSSTHMIEKIEVEEALRDKITRLFLRNELKTAFIKNLGV